MWIKSARRWRIGWRPYWSGIAADHAYYRGSSLGGAIADAGVPVMSHVGMCPHFMHQYGGFKLQGKTAEEALKIIDDGIAIQEAGCIGFEIEAVPAPVARTVDSAPSS